MSEQRRRDEERASRELAAFTDALLEGEEPDRCGRPPLAETVELLARALEPQPPPESLRRRVRQCIRAAWQRERRAENRTDAPLFQQLLEFLHSLGRSRRRWVWATAAALLVAAVAVTLLMPEEMGGTTGTAAGDLGVTVLAIVLVVAAVAGGVWVFVRRKK